MNVAGIIFRKRGGKSKPGFIIGRELCGGFGFVRIAMIYFHIIVSNDLLKPRQHLNSLQSMSEWLEMFRRREVKS